MGLRWLKLLILLIKNVLILKLTHQFLKVWIGLNIVHVVMHDIALKNAK